MLLLKSFFFLVLFQFQFLYSNPELKKSNPIQKKNSFPLLAKVLVDPNYFSSEGIKLKTKELVGSSKKNEFIYITAETIINKKKSYKVEMKSYPRSFGGPSREKNFIGFINPKQVNIFSPEEFSRYTLKNSKIDKIIIEKVNELYPNLNYSYANIEDLETKSFHLLTLLEGYSNSEGYGNSNSFSLIYQKQIESVKVFKGKLDLVYGEFKDIDLDNDGVPEIQRLIMRRTSYDTPTFYGFVDGEYRSLDLVGKIDFQSKKIIKHEQIDIPNSTEKNVKEIFYSYKNGKFIKD